jgi:outer membrane lipoprotein-sorting protein
VSDEQTTRPGNVLLRLVPKRAPDEFKQILAEVNPSSLDVARLVVIDRKGSRMDFLLSNVKENWTAPDDQFKFTQPPGVTIMRAERN